MRLKFNPTQHETPQRLLNNQGTQAARRTAGRPSRTRRDIAAARTKIRASVEVLVSAPSEPSGAQKGRSQIGKLFKSSPVTAGFAGSADPVAEHCNERQRNEAHGKDKQGNASSVFTRALGESQGSIAGISKQPKVIASKRKTTRRSELQGIETRPAS